MAAFAFLPKHFGKMAGNNILSVCGCSLVLSTPLGGGDAQTLTVIIKLVSTFGAQNLDASNDLTKRVHNSAFCKVAN